MMMKLIVALVLVCFAVTSAILRSDSNATAGDPSKFKSSGELYRADGNELRTEVGGWVSYKQCDSRWANQQLGWCDLTICSAGCAMSSVAMMLATKGVNVDPSTLDSYLSNNGGYANGCNIYWGRADDFGVTTFVGMQVANEQEICNGLAQNHGIIANVNNGGHWVLLTGCAGNGVFYVNDPGYSRTTYGIWEIGQEAVYH
jgi:hypothetical protein